MASIKISTVQLAAGKAKLNCYGIWGHKAYFLSTPFWQLAAGRVLTLREQFAAGQFTGKPAA
jgi:hypothetical protein